VYTARQVSTLPDRSLHTADRFLHCLTGHYIAFIVIDRSQNCLRGLLCHLYGPCIACQVSTLPPVWSNALPVRSLLYHLYGPMHCLSGLYSTTCMVHALPVRSLLYQLYGPCIACQVSTLPPVWSMHYLTGLYSATCLAHALPVRSLLCHLSGPYIA
jgi:hypothetical protein